jgi:hypothetical protein
MDGMPTKRGMSTQVHVSDMLKMPQGMKRRHFHDDMTVIVVYLPFDALAAMENSSHGSAHRNQRVLDRTKQQMRANGGATGVVEPSPRFPSTASVFARPDPIAMPRRTLFSSLNSEDDLQLS